MTISERTKRIQAWRKSEDYAKQYLLFQARGDHLIFTYEKNKAAIQQISQDLEAISVRTEIAGTSDLHRGFYCPSLVYDIVIGNVKRGKPLKRMTTRSKQYYIYGFDQNDQMVWCKVYYSGIHTYTEYFIYEGNSRYGFMLDKQNCLHVATQEQFENGKIVSFLYGLCCGFGGELVWNELRQEDYHYDGNGLQFCDWFCMRPMLLRLEHERYMFERENGYLKRYYVEELIGFEETEVVSKSPIYNVLVERKA